MYFLTELQSQERLPSLIWKEFLFFVKPLSLTGTQCVKNSYFTKLIGDGIWTLEAFQNSFLGFFHWISIPIIVWINIDYCLAWLLLILICIMMSLSWNATKKVPPFVKVQFVLSIDFRRSWEEKNKFLCVSWAYPLLRAIVKNLFISLYFLFEKPVF